MKIAVLGATGMIGQHVVEQGVQRSHEMIAVSRKPRDPGSNAMGRVEQRQADLNDVVSLRQGFRGADAVIHCAGYYPTRPLPLRDEIATATTLTTNFYEACADMAFQKIVYVGAAIAVPRNKDGSPSDGQQSYARAPSNPNAYLQVKWIQDDIARQQADRGMPVVIGIPAMTFGEYDPGNSTGRFILGVADGSMTAYVDGKRNVVYAGDAAAGLIRAAEAGQPGKRYLFTGENLTMQQLMDKIARITGGTQPKSVPLRVTKMLAAVQRFRYTFLRGPVPQISDTALAVMSLGQFLDGSAAEYDLGYSPSVSVDDAIDRAFTWFVSQKIVQRE